MKPRTEFFDIWEVASGRRQPGEDIWRGFSSGIIWYHLGSSGISWDHVGDSGRGSGKALGVFGKTTENLWEELRKLWQLWAHQGRPRSPGEVCGKSPGGLWEQLRRLWQVRALQELPPIMCSEIRPNVDSCVMVDVQPQQTHGIALQTAVGLVSIEGAFRRNSEQASTVAHHCK